MSPHKPPQAQHKARLTQNEILGLEKLIKTLIDEVEALKTTLAEHIAAEDNPPGV